jgi:hypothetical protein
MDSYLSTLVPDVARLVRQCTSEKVWLRMYDFYSDASPKESYIFEIAGDYSITLYFATRLRSIHIREPTSNDILPYGDSRIMLDTLKRLLLDKECKYLCVVLIFPYIDDSITVIIDEDAHYYVLIFNRNKIILPQGVHKQFKVWLTCLCDKWYF